MKGAPVLGPRILACSDTEKTYPLGLHACALHWWQAARCVCLRIFYESRITHAGANRYTVLAMFDDGTPHLQNKGLLN